MKVYESYNAEDAKVFLNLIKNNEFLPRDDLVYMAPINDQTIGRFIAPWMHTDKDFSTTYAVGQVLAIGPGEISSKGERLPMDVKIGDILLMNRAWMMRLSISGSYYYVTEQKHILGVLEEPIIA